MSKHSFCSNTYHLAMDLLEETFELPDGVLQYKAGWCMALATSMTFTTLVTNDGSWSEEEFLIFNCSGKVCFGLYKAFCLLKYM